MPDTAYVSVAEDLDAIRRSLDVDGDLSPHLARLLAACGGTLRHHVAATRSDRNPGSEA